MSDIKSLYLDAVFNKSNENNIAYENAVLDLSKNDPCSYLTQLEYIIKSDVGCHITENFIDENGLPIEKVDYVIEKCCKVIDEGKKKNKNTKDQEKLKNKVEEFKEYYSDIINMYRFLNENNPDVDEYIKTYYGKNKNGVQNRLLAYGLMKKFNELAIPDLLITADKLDSDSYRTVCNAIYEDYRDNHIIMQWMSEVCKVPEYVDSFYEYSSEKLYYDFHDKKIQSIKEAVLMEESTAVVVRTKEDIQNIEDLLYMREYQQAYSSEYDYSEELKDLYEDIKDLEESDDDENSTDDNIQPQILHVDRNASFNEYVSNEQLQSLLNKYDLNDFFISNGDISKVSNDIESYNNNNDILIITKPCENNLSLNSMPPEMLLKIFYDACGTTIFRNEDVIRNNVDSLSPSDLDHLNNTIIDVSNKYKSGGTFGNGVMDDDNIETFLDDWKTKLPKFPDMMNKLLNIISVGVDTNWDEWNSLVKTVNDISTASVDQFTRFCQFLDEYNGAAFTEETWSGNPKDQKTGALPAYLKDNHDILSYGEEEEKDDSKEKKKEPEGKLKTTLDDFKRPESQDNKIEPYDPDSDPLNKELDDEEEKEDKGNKEDNGGSKKASVDKNAASQNAAIHNYYYYSYNNSNNSYSNSHNSSNSHHNTSTANKRDDHSVTTNKRDSHNTTTSKDSHNVSNNTEKIDNHSNHHNSSSEKVDNHSNHHNTIKNKDDVKTEGFTDNTESVYTESEDEIIKELRMLQKAPTWKHERRTFYRMFNKDINLEGVIKDPDEFIKIMIGGINFSFKSEVYTKPGVKIDDNAKKNFGSVPTAIHFFNVYRKQLSHNNRSVASAIARFFSKVNKGVNESTSISTLANRYRLRSKNILFANDGYIFITFETNLKDAPIIAVRLGSDPRSHKLKCVCTALDKAVVESVSDFDLDIDEYIFDMNNEK